MKFYPGFNIKPTTQPMGFEYGSDVFGPEIYTPLGINTGKSIYTQFEENPEKFVFVPRPQLVKEVWENFVP